MQHGTSTEFALTSSTKPQSSHISSFLFAEELLCGVLLHWPHRSQPASLLLCGPSGNGKSHVVCRALQRARGATSRRRVLAVTPKIALSLSRRHVDGSTALREFVRHSIHDAVACPGSHHSGDEDGDAAVIVVLDHMELFITASDNAAGWIRGDRSSSEQSHSTAPHHPVVLTELYDIIRGRELFDEDELRFMHLNTVLFVTLFSGAWEDIDPFARAKLFDAYVPLETPLEEERFAFFRTHTKYPLLWCRAIAARSGGIPYRGLKEIVEHMEDVVHNATPAEHYNKMSVRNDGAVDDAAHDSDSETEAAAAIFSLRAVRAFGTSGSIAAQEYRQSAGYVDVQETRWQDIAGLESVKETLHRLVLRPLHSSTLHRRFGIRPSTGVLLYGPPGTGKTMLARAMATELNASFIYIDLPQLIQAEVGQSERRLRGFFDAARERSPSVMFIDELQAAFGTRRAPQGCLGSTHDMRLVTQFLHLLDKAQEDEEHFTLFVGATNVKEMLDEAVLRAGRLDTLVEVTLPDETARRSMVQRAVYGEWAAWFPANEVASQQALVCAFIKGTVGFSGAELRHAMNVFSLQFIRLASTKTRSGSAEFFQKLQDMMIQKETHSLSTYAQDALTRALTRAARP
ncbi:ATPase, putative [Trypanosoma cruzi]|nr:ATPase, putative [Trypanosoma cruzi]